MRPESPFLSPGVRLTDLAHAIGAHLVGPGDLLVTGVNSVEAAGPHDLACIANRRFQEAAHHSQAGAFILSEPCPSLLRPQLVSPNPQYDFIRLINRFFLRPRPAPSIAEPVWRGEMVRIGPEVTIGPFVTIGHRTTIGTRATLSAGVFLGEDVEIGEESFLHPHVTILDRCRIGSRVIIHSGAVIGSDGFGYVQHEGRHHKIPQLGIVVVEDDVEIGANVTIDRATFGETRIRRGTKIDNQVQIAHNVTVGEDCILVAQVGIAGSTTVGNGVMIGGQAGIIDHIVIGERAKIGAGAGVERDVDPESIVLGRPALSYQEALRIQPIIRDLPALREQLRHLEQRMNALESSHPHTPSRKKRSSSSSSRKK
ncbi:MAG: UDP-3-O-(3-hydroxymyristoyl)glucosamine N-acyltransferase [Nitrospirae bacterium]|nr:MAG: UDP-3-O-(3-hydroxymyristoyl)glucosamine N-acyltransferase [Nitrospirota bacterium]